MFTSCSSSVQRLCFPSERKMTLVGRRRASQPLHTHLSFYLSLFFLPSLILDPPHHLPLSVFNLSSTFSPSSPSLALPPAPIPLSLSLSPVAVKLFSAASAPRLIKFSFLQITIRKRRRATESHNRYKTVYLLLH